MKNKNFGALLFSFFIIGIFMFTLVSKLNAQEMIPDVYTLYPSFDDTRSYSPGDVVSGTFLLKNTGNIDASELYYSISTLDGFDIESTNFEFVYGEYVSKEPVFLPKYTDKTISFEYTIPSFTKSGTTALRVASYSSTGIMLGQDQKLIELIDTPEQQVELKKVSVIVGGVLFNLQAGPNVIRGEVPQVVFTLENKSSSLVTLTPKLSLHNRNTSLPAILEKQFDMLSLGVGEKKDFTLDLPTVDYKPGVYVASLRLVNQQNNDVIPVLYPRYIIGDDFAVVQSVSIDKSTDIKVGDTINLSLVYTGPVISINIPPSGIVDSKGLIRVVLINEKREVIATQEKEVELSRNVESLQDFALEAEKDALSVSAQIIISREGKILAEYNTDLTDPNIEAVEQTFFKGFIIPLLIVFGLGITVVIFFIFKKISSTGSTAMLFILFACGTLLVNTSVAEAMISKPYTDQEFVVNTQFDAASNFSHRTCNNVYGNIYVDISFEGNKKSQSRSVSAVGGAGTATFGINVSTNFTTPSIPGYYWVYSYGIIRHQYGTSDGNDKVRIKVVCPNTTTWSESLKTCEATEPGVCGATINTCTGGYLRDEADTSSQHLWKCLGTTNADCSLPKPGVCGPANNTTSFAFPAANRLCETGSNVSNQVTSTTGAPHTWTCTAGTGKQCSASRCPSNQTFCSVTNTCLPSGQTCANNTLNVQSSGAENVVIENNKGSFGGITNYIKTQFATINKTTLTAPAISSSRPFVSWTGQCDSINANKRSCEVTVSNGATKTVIANYLNSNPPNTLNVNSTGASGVLITSSIAQFGGATNYTRTSLSTINTLLTAPLTASGKNFASWIGCSLVNNTTCTVNISNGASRTVTASYTDGNSSPPNGSDPSGSGTSAPTGGACTISSPSNITYSLTPSIVNTPKDRCNLSWNVDYLNKGAVEAGNAICTPPGVSCTLNNVSVSLSGTQQINPGTYTLRCAGSDSNAYSRSFQCKVNPNYGEF